MVVRCSAEQCTQLKNESFQVSHRDFYYRSIPCIACTLYTYYVANGFTPIFHSPLHSMRSCYYYSIMLNYTHMTLFAKHAKCDVSKIPISVS